MPQAQLDDLLVPEEPLDNPNVELKEEIVKRTIKEVKFYEEIITMEQYLKEQGQDESKKLSTDDN